MNILPWWATELLAPFAISPILKVALEAAYLAWKELPLLKKLWELHKLRSAVKEAAELDHPQSIHDFTNRISLEDRVR